MQQRQEKIAPTGAGICGPLRRAGNGGGRERLGRPNRDGALLLRGRQRRAGPGAGLVAARAGNLYGTTLHGGAGLGKRKGVVFKLSPSGTETVLHGFVGGKRDGGAPQSPV